MHTNQYFEMNRILIELSFTLHYMIAMLILHNCNHYGIELHFIEQLHK